MHVSNVSFGNLIAVYGNPKKIDKIDRKVGTTAMVKDVTAKYKSSKPSGVLAQAAQSGNKVKLYITNPERFYIVNGYDGWGTISDIAEHIQDYYDINKMSISQVTDIITKQK